MCTLIFPLAVLGAAVVVTACDGGTEPAPATANGTTTTSGGTGGATSSGGGNSSTSPSGGNGGSGGSGGPQGGAPPTADLTNNEGFCDQFFIGPTGGGVWAAAKLTPPSYPYEVGQIRHQVHLGDPACSSLAHEVEVYVTSAAAPDATPVAQQSWVVPAAAEDAWGWVYLDLAPPIELLSGESLFVAVRLTMMGSQVLCLGCCEGEGFKLDHNFWSTVGEPPFQWARLEDFGFARNYRFEAFAAP